MLWVKRSKKSQDAESKMEVLDCIGMCVLGQMRHEKPRSVRRVEGFGVGSLGQSEYEKPRCLILNGGFRVCFA